MKMQQKNEVQKLCADVLDYGDLILVANKSHGKTHTLMRIAREFKNMEDTRIIVFEDFPKWIHEFDGIGYFPIHNKDVIQTKHEVDISDYFLRHSSDYAVRRGKQIREFLKENKHCIFTMQINDIERSCFFIYSIVNYFYRKAYLRAYKGYNKFERIIFIIEESQNVFDSSTVSKKLFNRLRKIFSVARNLGLHFVMATQRIQDLNTKIRGRSRLAIGKVNIDDYSLKISKLLRHSKYKKAVLNLPKGVFLYAPLDTLVSFPEFKQDSKPFEYKARSIPKAEVPTTQRKEKGLLHRLVNIFTFSPNLPEATQINTHQSIEEPEDLEGELEEEEDFILIEEDN